MIINMIVDDVINSSRFSIWNTRKHYLIIQRCT